jgi:hypothetical protein
MKILNNKKGLALAYVIIFGVILSIFAGVIFKIVNYGMKIKGHVIYRQNAKYTAQAGIEYALFRLRNSSKNYDNFLSDFTETTIEDYSKYEKTIDIDNPFSNEEEFLSEDIVVQQIKRKKPDIIITEVGMTADGLRPRYKVSAVVNYRQK